MYGDGESENGPKGTFEIYKAEADTLLKQGDYRKAVESYTIVSSLSFIIGYWMMKIQMKIALYQSQREIDTVAARAAPGDLGLKSHPKNYQQKLKY